MAKRKVTSPPTPLPQIASEPSLPQDTHHEVIPEEPIATPALTPPKTPEAQGKPNAEPPPRNAHAQDDISRFWSGAGMVFGVWVLAGFFGFVALVLLSADPVKPLPPLDRPHVEQTIGALLGEPSSPAERYAKLSIEIQKMLDAARLTDEALRKELKEALIFTKQVSVPKEYLLTPMWVEGAPSQLTQAIPVFRVEALNDATTPGSRAELSQSQPTWQKVSFGAVKSVTASWAAGDPLRLRFSLRDAAGLQPPITIGGDDVELASDAPLPGASMLLLGESRALTRGQGRYLVRVRTADGGVLVPPLLLLRSLENE